MMLGNCLVCAFWSWLRAPARTRIRWLRNRMGQRHYYWVADGCCYEFYARGRSGKTYLQNLLYRGRVRRFGNPGE